MSSNLARDATRSTGAAAYKETAPKNPHYVALRRSNRRVSGLDCQGEEYAVTTLAKALLKYRLKHRPDPLGTERFWLTVDGRPLEGGRIEKIVAEYKRKAGLKRCYPHKLRHTSSVMYLRNGGDPFSLRLYYTAKLRVWERV